MQGVGMNKNRRCRHASAATLTSLGGGEPQGRSIAAGALSLGLLLTYTHTVTYAQDVDVIVAPVVVTPTRVEQPSFDLPVSIEAYDQQVIQTAQPQVNVSETLIRSPGVVANERQNYAQDLQISIRGFGARATFGVRGIRLIADGIPLTMPDGQGQTANIDLGSAQRIEVMRGPFSSLYGNSSGGVINVFTEDGPEQTTVSGTGWLGDFGSNRLGLKLGGQQGSLNYVLSGARFDTNGYREHSAATRDTVNTKLFWDTSQKTRVTLVANYLNQPETQDPRGLTKEQVAEDPTQAGDGAVEFNTRKSVEHAQTGAVLDQQLTALDAIRLMGYGGKRTVEQYLGFGAPGRGVIGLDRNFYGVDLRWNRQTELGNNPFTFTLGINYDNMEERRNSWTNDDGNKGALGRDEDDRVYNFDQFLQLEWTLSERWIFSGGVRNSEVTFKSVDYFITGTNPDDSGEIEFSEVTPVAGVVFKVKPTFNLYANAGKGFETPTFSELAYSSTDGSVTGMNRDLKPATSDNYEIGAKAFISANTRVNAAVFYIDTKNEIVVFSNSGGRSVYQNIDSTSREGFELAVDSRFGSGFSGLLSYSYIDATFDNEFGACLGFCSTAAGPNVTVPAGNKIPGIPENMVYGELAWGSEPTGMSTAVEARWVDKIYTNDINDEFAHAYTVVNWRINFEQVAQGWRYGAFARINNLFDEQYVGAVIVNESGRRYYEPAPGRNFIVGASASYAF
jgi:iron complex outermembrane receptor protein